MYIIVVCSSIFTMIIHPPAQGIAQDVKIQIDSLKISSDEIKEKEEKLQYKLELIKYFNKENKRVDKLLTANKDTIIRRKALNKKNKKQKKIITPITKTTIYKILPIEINTIDENIFSATFPNDTISTFIIPLKSEKVGFFKKIINSLKHKSKRN